MTKPIDTLAAFFPPSRVIRQEDGKGNKADGFSIQGITPSEAATTLRYFADMLEKGEIQTHGISMMPRGRGKNIVLQAFTLWFGSRD